MVRPPWQRIKGLKRAPRHRIASSQKSHIKILLSILALTKSRPSSGATQDSNNSSGPLIVYLPIAPYTYQSNFTTFDLEYSNADRNEIIRNGYNVATMGNGTVDSDWPPCVGCAILARSLARTDTKYHPNVQIALGSTVGTVRRTRRRRGHMSRSRLSPVA
jgi:hypothetical protein